MLIIDGFSIIGNNLQIENSYKIKNRQDMGYILNDIRKVYGNLKILKCRNNKSLIEEWAAHNLLYDMGLFKSHTKDVDLNYPQNKVVYFIYKILSWIYFKNK